MIVLLFVKLYGENKAEFKPCKKGLKNMDKYCIIKTGF